VKNFDRKNVDELIKIHQDRQYFALSKICAIRYSLIQIQIDLYTLIEQLNKACTIILMHKNVRFGNILCTMQVPNVAFYVEYKFKMM